MLPRLVLLWSLSSKHTQSKCHPSDPLCVSPWGYHLVSSSCSSNTHLCGKGRWQQCRTRTHHQGQEQTKVTPPLSSPPLSSQLLYSSQCRDTNFASACSCPTTSSVIRCVVFSGWIWMISMNCVHPTRNAGICSSCLPQDTGRLLSHTSGSLLLVLFHFGESQFQTWLEHYLIP